MLYASEVNTASQAKSRVRLVSSSNPGYSRTLRIPLGRYGMLNRLFLHTTWSAGGGTLSTTTVGTEPVPAIGAFCWSECRLVSQGATIAKIDPYTLVAELMTNSSDEDLKKHQELLGLFDCKGSAGVAGDADKDARNPALRVIAGTAPNDGITHYYCELPFWFSRRNNLALDLGILANEVQLEIDIESQSNIWKEIGSAGDHTFPALSEAEVLCYITELDDATEKEFRSLTYSPGQPVTQLAYNNSHSLVGSAIDHASSSVNTKFALKLNQFSGLVQKLYVFGVTTDTFQTNSHRFRPIQLSNLKLTANGSEIYKLEELTNKEDIVEALVNQTRWRGSSIGATCVTGTNKVTFGQSGDVAYTNTAPTNAQATAFANAIIKEVEDQNYQGIQDFSFVPNHVYVISFKNPFDFSKVSCNGVASFDQLSLPTLEGEITTKADGFHANVLAGSGSTKVDIHVCAVNQSLVSYITNSAGSTTIRMIES